MTAHAGAYSDPRTDHRLPPVPCRDFDRPHLSIVAIIGKCDDATEKPRDFRDFKLYVAGNWREMIDAERHFTWMSDSRTAIPHEVSMPPLSGEFETAIGKFGAGMDGACPDAAVIMAARAIWEAAVHRTTDPEVAVDDVDGALSFDLRLQDGRLVLAELFPDGKLHVGVYDKDDELLEHRTIGYEYLVSVIES